MKVSVSEVSMGGGICYEQIWLREIGGGHSSVWPASAI